VLGGETPDQFNDREFLFFLFFTKLIKHMDLIKLLEKILMGLFKNRNIFRLSPTDSQEDFLVNKIVAGENCNLEIVENRYSGQQLVISFGSINPDGVTVVKGPQGAQGEAGAIGNQGVAGVMGVTGATGVQGVQGAIGAQGAAGEAGYSCNNNSVISINANGIIGNNDYLVLVDASKNPVTVTLPCAKRYRGSLQIVCVDASNGINIVSNSEYGNIIFDDSNVKFNIKGDAFTFVSDKDNTWYCVGRYAPLWYA
jgi:hypothetical protein